MPKETNLRGEYSSFAELEEACEQWCEQINDREHRVTRRAPAEMLVQERARLHTVPTEAYTVALGATRQVPVNSPMVTFESGQYSVPHTLLGQTVWVRAYGAGAGEQPAAAHRHRGQPLLCPPVPPAPSAPVGPVCSA